MIAAKDGKRIFKYFIGRSTKRSAQLTRTSLESGSSRGFDACRARSAMYSSSVVGTCFIYLRIGTTLNSLISLSASTIIARAFGGKFINASHSTLISARSKARSASAHEIAQQPHPFLSRKRGREGVEMKTLLEVLRNTISSSAGAMSASTCASHEPRGTSMSEIS